MDTTECPLKGLVPSTKTVTTAVWMEGEAKFLQTSELNFWKMIMAGMQDTLDLIIKQIQQAVTEGKPTKELFNVLEDKVDFYKKFAEKKPKV